MAYGAITANTATSWLTVSETPTHIALGGTFDSASIALEQEINGTAYPVLDVNDTAITYTAAIDDPLNLNKGDRIRLNPTGGGVSLDVDWSIAGAGTRFPYL
jgi:hypothetical protein